MGKLVAVGLACVLAVQGCAQEYRSSLDAVQGAWWSDCDDAAAVFLIEGDEYSGDFAGTYRLTVRDSVLVFSHGLPEGHAIDVTHEPLSFRILVATGSRLVLRPLPGYSRAGDWDLQSCIGISRD